MIRNDEWIRAMCYQPGAPPMIEPFEPQQVRELSPTGGWPQGAGPRRCISYGTSSYGYDARCGDEFRVFSNARQALIDPKAMPEDAYVEIKGKGHCIIPPNSFALTHSVEYIRVPRDVIVICMGKSTYARCGLIVNVTPLEPEWEGQITLEISNTSPLPAKVYSNEGIVQLLFFKAEHECRTSYADRGGKYQGQRGVVLARA